VSEEEEPVGGVWQNKKKLPKKGQRSGVWKKRQGRKIGEGNTGGASTSKGAHKVGYSSFDIWLKKQRRKKPAWGMLEA